ncbi:MAG: hypothetical protein L6408_01585, partial [Nanoarchaeota archaeon]|nr:hypothetical protein [Nanoarchaeota archaeon]
QASTKYYNPEDYVNREEEIIKGVRNRHQKWKKEMRYKKKEIKQRERALRRKQKLETKVGVYPISGGKPFITNEFMVEKKIRKNKLSEDDFTYTDIKGFAYAVATRAIESYNLGDIKASKLEGLVQDKSFLNQTFVKDFRKNHYNLPEQHLAMDILLCLKYCKDEFEKYVGGLAGNLYKLSIIQHERIKKRTPEDIEKRADQLLTPLYQKKK